MLGLREFPASVYCEILGILVKVQSRIGFGRLNYCAGGHLPPAYHSVVQRKKEGKREMFEITYRHSEKLLDYISRGVAYENGTYDFTFENTYLIYHYERGDSMDYIAVDMRNELSSHIIRRKNHHLYDKESFRMLIPNILDAVKFNGERRYLEHLLNDPMVLIDFIFRTVLVNRGYSIREEQIDLCKKILNGFIKKKISICEAEVGTGKTLAYLVAGFVAKQYQFNKYGLNFPITISTSNIELQHSIIAKDIPMLSSALLEYRMIASPLTSTLRKGKEHYFCLRRYNDYLSQLGRYPKKHSSSIELLAQLQELPFGIDLDNYKIGSGLKYKICVADECWNCSLKNDCPYISQMRKNSKSTKLDFQVTNHNLFITSIKNMNDNNMKLLCRSSYVVIDEAHKFKAVAEDVYTEKINRANLEKFIKRIRCDSIKELNYYKECIKEISRCINYFFEDLVLMNSSENTDEDNDCAITLSPYQLGVVSKIVNALKYIEQNGKNSINRKTARILCETFEKMLERREYIVYLEGKENADLTVCIVPKNINDIMKEKIWKTDSRFILTSGTMSDGKNFEYFKRENGLTCISNQLLQETKNESGFNYDNNSRLYIPDDIPYPNNDDWEYLNAIAERCYDLIEATNGHTVILFTSYKVLNAVYMMLKERLGKYDLICMTRGNKTSISDFKKSSNGVLFASGSMWEGVDCKGDGLSSLIIVRLPFPMRSIVLEENKDEDVAKFIKETCLPNMLIKLRQGAGRLIRTEKDTGVISILDARASQNGRYRKNVLNALKKYPLIDSIEAVGCFIKNVKSESYFAE